MQWRKLLFIKLLILLSIAPHIVGAQYSFQGVLKTRGDDASVKMSETSDGRFLLIGGSSGNGSVPSGSYIACFNNQGTVLWQKYNLRSHYGASIGLGDILQKNNNFYIGGGAAVWQYFGNAAYINMDNNGNVLWDSAYQVGDGGGGSISSFIDDSSNQVLISIGLGATDDNHAYSMFQKTTYTGQRIMYKYIMETLNIRLRDFYKSPDQSGYTMFCDVGDYASGWINYLIRLDNDGNTLSKKSIGTDQINAIIQNDNSTYTANVIWNFRNYIVTYDTTGAVISNKLVPSNNLAGGLVKTKDNGFAMVGAYLIVLDSNINVVKEIKLWKTSDKTSLSMFAQASDGSFYGCGQYECDQDAINVDDFYIFKTAPDGTLTNTITSIDIPVTGINEAMNISDKIKIYPNPAIDRINFEGISPNAKVTINNTLGQIVYSGSTDSIDVSEFSKGVYFVSIIDNEGTETIRKIVVR